MLMYNFNVENLPRFVSVRSFLSENVIENVKTGFYTMSSTVGYTENISI